MTRHPYRRTLFSGSTDASHGRARDDHDYDDETDDDEVTSPTARHSVSPIRPSASLVRSPSPWLKLFTGTPHESPLEPSDVR